MKICFMLMQYSYLLSVTHSKSSITARNLLHFQALRQPQKNILSPKILKLDNAILQYLINNFQL